MATAVCESGDHARCAGWHTAKEPYGPCECPCHAQSNARQLTGQVSMRRWPTRKQRDPYDSEDDQ